MKVLIVPEDPTLDQHVLRPIVEHIFADLGRPARIEVLRDPHLRSVAQALDRTILGDIIADNPMIDLFLLMVDRDCNRGTIPSESRAKTRESEHPDRLIACLAVEEVETWLLALLRDEIATPWREVRAECHPKERFWAPLAEQRGWHRERDGGRVRVIRELLGPKWRGLLGVCPELQELKDRIAAWWAARAT